MFSLLKYHLPATSVIPIKMLRYVKSNQFRYDSNEIEISPDHISNFNEQEFMEMQGKIIFCINTGKDKNHLKVSITSISLFDLDNKFLVHGLEETLSTQVNDDNGKIELVGKILITNKSILSTGEIKLNINHSHDDLFEISINIYDDINKELAYGITLIKQAQKNSYAETFAVIK